MLQERLNHGHENDTESGPVSVSPLPRSLEDPLRGTTKSLSQRGEEWWFKVTGMNLARLVWRSGIKKVIRLFFPWEVVVILVLIGVGKQVLELSIDPDSWSGICHTSARSIRDLTPEELREYGLSLQTGFARALDLREPIRKKEEYNPVQSKEAIEISFETHCGLSVQHLPPIFQKLRAGVLILQGHTSVMMNPHFSCLVPGVGEAQDFSLNASLPLEVDVSIRTTLCDGEYKHILCNHVKANYVNPNQYETEVVLSGPDAWCHQVLWLFLHDCIDKRSSCSL